MKDVILFCFIILISCASLTSPTFTRKSIVRFLLVFMILYILIYGGCREYDNLKISKEKESRIKEIYGINLDLKIKDSILVNQGQKLATDISNIKSALQEQGLYYDSESRRIIVNNFNLVLGNSFNNPKNVNAGPNYGQVGDRNYTTVNREKLYSAEEKQKMFNKIESTIRSTKITYLELQVFPMSASAERDIVNFIQKKYGELFPQHNIAPYVYTGWEVYYDSTKKRIEIVLGQPE